MQELSLFMQSYLSVVVHPSHREIFLVTELATPLERIFFLRVWSTFLLRLLLFLLWFLSCHCLTSPVHSGSEFSAFLPCMALFQSIYAPFCLTVAYTRRLSHCKLWICAMFAQTIAYTFPPCLFSWFGVCWVGFDACWAFLGLCSAC